MVMSGWRLLGESWVGLVGVGDLWAGSHLVFGVPT